MPAAMTRVPAPFRHASSEAPRVSYEQIAPALWGLGGALIYAGPRLSACLFAAVGAAEAPSGHGKCVLDFVIACLAGAICAAAFASPLAGLVGLKAYPAAIAALVGLTANKLAPTITDGASALFMNALNGRVLDLLKGPPE